MTKTKVLIDIQGAQAPSSRYRGIGRYTISMVKAMLRNPNYNCHLLVNGAFPETLSGLRSFFSSYINPAQFHVWYPPQPCAYYHAEQHTYKSQALEVRESTIASIKPDVLMVSSLFEGFADDCAVAALNGVAREIPSALISYDLIPLLYPQDYLDNSDSFKAFYLQQIEELKQADAWAAISTSSKEELQDNLDVDHKRVINVSAGLDESFAEMLKEPNDPKVLQKLNVESEFILYTGGADSRKNLCALIEAFAKLPKNLVSQYQLIFAGKVHPTEQARLAAVAKRYNLNQKRVIFTGYIDDSDLLQLYRQAKLFVFPSLHEGFGLPPLEAMACGTATIASNTSSLPEVIGLPEAQFNPRNVNDISVSIQKALEDEVFHKRLIDHGIQQVKLFTWEFSAQKAFETCEIAIKNKQSRLFDNSQAEKKSLAIVTPLPPLLSGVANYTAKLIENLQYYYEITLINDQDVKNTAGFPIYDSEWFLKNSLRFDRVLYQVGASLTQEFVLNVVAKIPGVIVLHDFYYGYVSSHQELFQNCENIWGKKLHLSHGLKVAKTILDPKKIEYIAKTYSVNLEFLQHSRGVIVHSKSMIDLANHTYSQDLTEGWRIVPHLSTNKLFNSKEKAREQLEIENDDFVVATFGIIDESKFHTLILESFADVVNCVNGCIRLIFVGQPTTEPYHQKLISLAKTLNLELSFHITGAVSNQDYHKYLAAVDLAVQLRRESRGETSGAVIDCLSYGLPTILNKVGSSADVVDNADIVDNLNQKNLANKITELISSRELLNDLSYKAQKITKKWSPENCAKLYYDSIESSYPSPKEIALSQWKKKSLELPKQQIPYYLNALSESLPQAYQPKRLFLDLSATELNGLESGIERYARKIAEGLLDKLGDDYHVEYVQLSNSGNGWRYYNATTLIDKWLDYSPLKLGVENYTPTSGDIVLSLDWSCHNLIEASKDGYFDYLHARGVKVGATLFDLLPLQLPQYFPETIPDLFKMWLDTISNFDFVLTISKDTKQRYHRILDMQGRHYHPEVFSLRLGSDFLDKPNVPESFCDTSGLSEILLKPTLLMVGTIEPRKGHIQVIEALNMLWKKGVDFQLLIIGREGWVSQEGEINKGSEWIVEQIENNSEYGSKLHWKTNVQDAELNLCYKQAKALVFASEGEGFGLPLVEAMQFNLPIIARDIPVFREVSEDYPFYFEDKISVKSLSKFIHDCLNMGLRKEFPKIPVVKWDSTVNEIATILTKDISDPEIKHTMPVYE